MFDLEELRLFVSVAGTGSFTGAAAELNYTQSAVSRRIAALEQEAGGPLFDRLARGVRLTPAGRVLHRHALELLEREAAAGRELAALHSGRAGILRVGAFATANVALVPSALARFRTSHPEVETVPWEGRSSELVERLASGALDLAVISDYPSGLPPVDGVTVTPLLTDELSVALPAGHPLAGSGPLPLAELSGETWIQHGPADRPTRLSEACAQAGFTPRRILRIAEWTGKFGYVAAGLGVTLVPSLAAAAVPPSVVLRPLRDPTPARAVHLALPATPLPAAYALAALLRP
ncbi:LysR family transcriptional regulator [Actinocorallia longicatena]|uniref:LysR family transcriptional regulator n=1 Tax=Actinocorallia longicatena TaxID=111803 RepID=A0ABP6QII2_9ACTN